MSDVNLRFVVLPRVLRAMISNNEAVTYFINRLQIGIRPHYLCLCILHHVAIDYQCPCLWRILLLSSDFPACSFNPWSAQRMEELSESSDIVSPADTGTSLTKRERDIDIGHVTSSKVTCNLSRYGNDRSCSKICIGNVSRQIVTTRVRSNRRGW